MIDGKLNLTAGGGCREFRGGWGTVRGRVEQEELGGLPGGQLIDNG